MLYLFSALYCEAQPLLKPLRLKRCAASPFQQFSNDDQSILLTLTNPGPTSAAAAVSAVLAKRPPKDSDFLLNLGTCAMPFSGAAAASSLTAAPVFRLTKLIDFSSLRSFYPDLIYPSHFPEAGCITGARVLSLEAQELCSKHISAAAAAPDSSGLDSAKSTGASPKAPGWQADLLALMHQQHCPLYDMEAAAVCQTGSLFLGPQQLHFLRLVTDAGKGQSVKSEDISQGMESRLPELLSEIRDFLDRSRRLSALPPVLKPEDEALLGRLCTDLHCSAVMTAQLRQLVTYLSLAGLPWQTQAEALYANGTLPCRDKRSGKKVLDAFRAEFL